MSRGGDYDYEENFPNQAALWWNAAERALKGKRGRKALAELREALLMLPEKRLVAGAISTASLDAKARTMPDEVESFDFHNKVPTMRPNYGKQDALERCATEGIGVCAVGAYLLRKRVMETGESVEEAMRALLSSSDVEGYYFDETASLGEAAGLRFTLAYLLAQRNDEYYEACTPEERYEKFLGWIDRELGVAA